MGAPHPDDMLRGMALISTIKAGWELGLPQILEEAGLEGMKVADIASRVISRSCSSCSKWKPSSGSTTHNHDHHDAAVKCEEALRRILRFLSAHSLVSCCFRDSNNKNNKSQTETYYSLPLLPHGFVDSEAAAAFNHHIWPSLAPRALLALHPRILSSWINLSQTVLNASASHDQEDLYTIMNSDPALRRAFDASMMSLSSSSIRAFCTSKVYDMDPDGRARSLVDVGGGSGHFAAAIARRYPHLQRVINFDLPSVISAAPPHPGVEHIQGDMFQSIPSADIIFMKSVLHNWSDEKCIQILHNCHKSLTGCKKLVILDVVLRDTTSEETHISNTCAKHAMDISMLATFPMTGGKSRTENEWSVILKKVKFEDHKFSEIDETRSLFSIIEVIID